MSSESNAGVIRGFFGVGRGLRRSLRPMLIAASQALVIVQLGQASLPEATAIICRQAEAYFNEPLMPGKKISVPEAVGGYAMSQPAWDRRRRSVWYTDGNTGFYVVGLTNGVGRLLD